MIVANIYETYNYLIKEIEKDYKITVLKENYLKILTLMMPVLPHMISEAFKDLNHNEKLQWPKTEAKYLEEKYVNIVVQVNGKKKSLIKIEKDLGDKEVINIIKKDERITNILSDKNLLKHIIVKNRLVNFIVK